MNTKKQFFTVAALIAIVLVLTAFMVSCLPPDIDNNYVPAAPLSTFIVFDNTGGKSAVSVYNDPQRKAGNHIALVPAGEHSELIEFTPSASTFFYLSYRVILKDISFSLYVPRRQINPRIDKDTTTNIILPSFDEAFSGFEGLLSNNSHLLIRNNSSFPFELFNGQTPLRPGLSSSSSIVNAGNSAEYTIDPGMASNYQLWTGGRFILFSGSGFPETFKEGYVYSLDFDGNNISLVKSVEIKLENAY